MGFLDKLKNVFFEEEEIEEEEIEESKPKLARKVEIPKKKPPIALEEKEEVRVESQPEFTESVQPVREETIIREEVRVTKEEVPNKFAMMFEEDDFVLEEPPKAVTRETVERSRTLYPEKREESYSESIKKDNSYGYTKSYYESREKKTFTPSPIISPIYGILDKNYKKEEVVTKKEIRISSSRNKVDLDTVRSKAFGEEPEEFVENKVSPKIEKEETMYDVNKNKPSVKGITLEAADEYYRDLGLAYNVDYSDQAKEVKTTKKSDTGRLEDNLFDLIESMYDKED